MSNTQSTSSRLQRATSDYLSVSRRAELFGPGEYERAEARAWARLQAALDQDVASEARLEPEGDVAQCAGSS